MSRPQAVDNIAMFLAWAEHLGVPSAQLFAPDDLLEGTNDLKVHETLLEVDRIQRSVKHSRLVQLEQLLDSKVF